MKTPSALPRAAGIPSRLYYQLVYTLTDVLPPPLDASPEALQARNHAAIAKVAALLPVNADDIDLAARCIATRAQADDLMRLTRRHAGDIELVMRLNAQYSSMLRTSLSVRGRLMRVQALRRKREATEAAVTEDAWTQHVTEQSMLAVADAAPVPRPAAPPQTPPPATASQKIAEIMSRKKTSSHDVVFETWLSEQSWNRKPEEEEAEQRRVRIQKAMIGSLLPRLRERARQEAANGRASPG